MSKRPLTECRIPKVPVHPSLLLAPIALIFWVIALAGAAATHKQCTKRSGSDEYCTAQFGLIWATVFFEFISLVALFGLLPTKFASSVRVMFAVLLTIPTTLWMTHAQSSVVVLQGMGSTTTTRYDAFGNLRTYTVSTPADYKSAYQTAAAGSTLMIIINLILIIYLLVEVPTCEGCTTADVVKKGNAQAAPAAPAAPMPVQAAPVPPV